MAKYTESASYYKDNEFISYTYNYEKSVQIKREPVETKLAQSPQKSYGYNPCNCVSFARWKTGIDVGIIGVAGNHPVNSINPIVGGYVIFKGNPGHIAVVTSVDNDFITIEEANYKPCAYGTRTINLNQSNIKGYYYWF